MTVCLEDVVVGDLIKTRDEKTRNDTYVEIMGVHDHGKLDVYEFSFDTGETVTCTLDHKFRTTCGKMLPIKDIIVQGLEVVIK